MLGANLSLLPCDVGRMFIARDTAQSACGEPRLTRTLLSFRELRGQRMQDVDRPADIEALAATSPASRCAGAPSVRRD